MGEIEEAVPVTEEVVEHPAEKPEAEPPVSHEAPASTYVSSWPFLVYDAVWAGFALLLVQQLSGIPKGVATTSASIYPVLVSVGVALAVGGPVLAFAVWFSTERDPETRFPLLVDALIRAAVATLIGVVLWWAGFVVVDVLRSGSVF